MRIGMRIGMRRPTDFHRKPVYRLTQDHTSCLKTYVISSYYSRPNWLLHQVVGFFGFEIVLRVVTKDTAKRRPSFGSSHGFDWTARGDGPNFVLFHELDWLAYDLCAKTDPKRGVVTSIA